MIKSDTVLELLKETYIANMYFTKSARQLSVVQRLICF